MANISLHQTQDQPVPRCSSEHYPHLRNAYLFFLLADNYSSCNKKLSYLTLHPVRLSIGSLQNHTSWFKKITSIHCQRPLQKHVNSQTDIAPVSTCPLRDLVFLECDSVVNWRLETIDDVGEGEEEEEGLTSMLLYIFVVLLL